MVQLKNHDAFVTDPFRIIDGWLYPATHLASPNFNARPLYVKPRLIVIHNISLPPAQFGGGYVQQFFMNQLDKTIHPYFETIADVQVSAHLFIERSGQITQFVSFDARAWHAGASHYLGVAQCNDYSIGIELEGADNIPFENAQYEVLSHVICAIQNHYLDTVYHLAGHSDIAPIRKTDPSDSFQWESLRIKINQIKNNKNSENLDK